MTHDQPRAVIDQLANGTITVTKLSHLCNNH